MDVLGEGVTLKERRDFGGSIATVLPEFPRAPSIQRWKGPQSWGDSLLGPKGGKLRGGRPKEQSVKSQARKS